MQLSLISDDATFVSDSPFERWLADHGRRLRRDSVTAYHSIWRSFSGFAQLHGRTIESIDVSFLELFLEEIEPRAGAGVSVSPRYAWRVLNLLNRVFEHHAANQEIHVNDSVGALLKTERFKYVNARNNEPLPEIFEPRMAALLVKRLTTSELPEINPSWKFERDRAALAIMLGSGLTPMEVRRLKFADLSLRPIRGQAMPWKIRAAGTAKTAEHDAPIAHWARRCVRRWLLVREQLTLNHDSLFPATLTRANWTDIGCQAACTQTLIELLGDEVRYGGLLRLRNTFIVRQMQRGIPIERIALWLGVVSVERLERFRRVLTRDEFVV